MGLLWCPPAGVTAASAAAAAAVEAHYIVMKDSPDRPLRQAGRTARASVALGSMLDRSSGRAAPDRSVVAVAALLLLRSQVVAARTALVAVSAAPAAVGNHPIAARMQPRRP
jgi:hypothetical protein